MSLKREVSKSIANLQHSVKRLAIGEQEDDTEITSSISPSLLNMENEFNVPALEQVLSTSRQDFDETYEKLDEIGRGGFSVVYRCRSRVTGEIFAVKIIDLRPLRLREKFNPARLRREVDIMRRLRHPNVIQFVEVYETEDQLLVVMEYAPGKELFDVILERKYFSEEDAKPIFEQIASAVNHLHSMDIIHRDIKPENILILNARDESTGLPIAKLLDFGLSKHAGLGSAARTFVGTPCYQAPEVEFTAKGLGGTYGPAADCWSLGAVLYVMLVARFPEFDHNVGYEGRKVLRLPEALWANVSSEAKNLIQSLMCFETDVRLTAAEALRHEWLGQYRIVDVESGSSGYSAFDPGYMRGANRRNKTSIPPSVSTNSGTPHGTRGNDVMDMVLSDHYSQNVRRLAQESAPPVYSMHSGVDISSQYPGGGYGMRDDLPPPPHSQQSSGTSFSRNDMGVMTRNPNGAAEHLPLAPLLHLQRNIATTFEKASMSYAHNPELATHVRTAAVMCRQQILDSTKLLRKIEQTSLAVLNMFPDLELAVEENVPELAVSFFDMVRQWIGELIVLVNTTQSGNRASISQLQVILNMSHQETNQQLQQLQQLSALSLSAHNRQHTSSSSASPSSSNTTVNMSDVRDAVMHLKERAGVKPLSGNDILELFSNLFGQDQWQEKGVVNPSPRIGQRFSTPNRKGTPSMSSTHSSSDADDLVIGGSPTAKKGSSKSLYSSAAKINAAESTPLSSRTNADDSMDTTMEFPRDSPAAAAEENVMTRYDKNAQNSGKGGGEGVDGRIAFRYDQMESALDMLRQVDLILEQLGVFWANTEVVLDALTKKGQHAENFVGFARNPKLMNRFKERVNEYRNFWEGVTSMCHTYLMGIVEPEDTLSRFATPPEEVLSATSSTSSTPNVQQQDSSSSTASSSHSKQQSSTASYLYSK